MIIIDSSYYGKTVIAPLNIVLYNVFSNKGPTLYGTEPWTFYLLNGILNFNLMFIATLISPFMLLLSLRFNYAIKQKLIIISTVFLWIGFFVTIPHKVSCYVGPQFLFCQAMKYRQNFNFFY